MDIQERFLLSQSQLKVLKQDHEEVNTLKEFLESYDNNINSIGELDETISQLMADVKIQMKRCRFSLKHETESNPKKVLKRTQLLRKQLVMLKYYLEFEKLTTRSSGPSD